MNRQLYADGTDDRGIMSQVRDLIQGIVPKSKYMLPLSKLEQIADAQGVSIEEANNMVMRWAMGTSDPKGLEKLFIPKMRREPQDILRKFNEFDPRQARQIQQAVGESQDIPEYYDPRLQILDPEQMQEEMQNPSMPMRDMRMGGGIMSVARENYGIGSSFKKAFKKVAKIADPIIQAAAVIPNPYQPFAQAYTAGRSLGIGGDYKGLQLGPYTPGAYGGDYGLNPLKGFGGKYGITRTGEGLNVFNKPIQGSEFFKLAQNTPIEPFVGDEILYSPNNLSATDLYRSISTSDQASGIKNVFDFFKGSAKSISDVLSSISSDNMKNIIEAGKLGFALYSSNLAKKDQERINENLERVQREYEAKVAAKKSEYEVGTPMTVTRGEVNPVRAPAAYGGRMGFAYGSIDEGIMAAPQIANMMGMPVGNPRQNQQGVAELDYRDQGGFVPPIGIKEKADDIPAMLSNNEFVFTANAVKNADPSGNRDPEEGAKVMYRTMKMLENGGMV
jgi:hypothetical protein